MYSINFVVLSFVAAGLCYEVRPVTYQPGSVSQLETDNPSTTPYSGSQVDEDCNCVPYYLCSNEQIKEAEIREGTGDIKTTEKCEGIDVCCKTINGNNIALPVQNTTM
ncbi:uncharacterized protein LOC129004446 isoform X2 [Macrosteles quadrilineatus]|uniref:uncharacterized protein LOC129004446 isoform X2 n=1 Tax=Macrosteles quadrilineatus TaxID=74068 RepID=UPI0023E1F709|nr:uncharacterized protein LOC129004446 isoform X2 [Macrosteles quadrilineatus]